MNNDQDVIDFLNEALLDPTQDFVDQFEDYFADKKISGLEGSMLLGYGMTMGTQFYLKLKSSGLSIHDVARVLRKAEIVLESE